MDCTFMKIRRILIPLIVSVSNHRIPVLEKEIAASTPSCWLFLHSFLYPHPTQSNGEQLVVSIIAVADPEGEGGGSKGRQGGSSGAGGSRSMDCCICSPMATMYRLPRNTICAPCYEGAKAIIGFLNKDEQEEDDGHGSAKSPVSTKLNSSTKGMGHACQQVKEMRDREDESNQKAAFLEQGFALAWKDGMHTDIDVRPGTGAPIPAHKAILAARSEVFRHVLSSDEQCKAPAGDSISLPELSHDELSLLLAFLYTGALEQDLPERHLHALLVAADKYDVPFLRRACEARLAAAVEPRNVLRTLEVADLSSSAVLRERAMDTVVEHAEQVVFSAEYEEFAVRNAGLCVEITRALLASMSATTTNKEPCIEDVHRGA
ncbi:hypothetical protein SETIT_8G016000v2 [Setaria italica]|uniref:BTB domain-containing protein n=1 Tax=Setaria italica TaxID=4555 RepID=A0A368S3D2_SETIT|nr:BTB/POZ domain-containing protein At3g56230 [Setaria italica]RCV36871.1 hypothetical protein SETIT_8G016000v2 [Setaria italica]